MEPIDDRSRIPRIPQRLFIVGSHPRMGANEVVAGPRFNQLVRRSNSGFQTFRFLVGNPVLGRLVQFLK
jgi:hypothetical protein